MQSLARQLVGINRCLEQLAGRVAQAESKAHRLARRAELAERRLDRLEMHALTKQQETETSLTSPSVQVPIS